MSDLALYRISENKKNKEKFLDLGNCNLREVPVEIEELYWLEGLSLTDDWWEWDGYVQKRFQSKNHGESNRNLVNIVALKSLRNLRCLYLGDTRVFDLTPLARLVNLENLDLRATRISTIEPLRNLLGLRHLYLNSAPISDISPLEKMINMTSLYLSSTRVFELTPLSGLNGLRTLHLNSTPISNIAPLRRLLSLRNLQLAATWVADLTPLSGLSNLQSIDLISTLVTDLSPLENMIKRGYEVSLHWDDGDQISVTNCKISNPPIEIVAQGRAAILNYFEERRFGQVDHLYEAKMLILGDGSSGKTSLVRRLYQPDLPLPLEEETTKGIAIHYHQFLHPCGRKFRLNVWDFGGQEIYHATHQFFLTKRSLYVLLDDTRMDHKLASDPGFRDWLDVIELFGGNSSVLIFQNEKGGRSKQIDMDGIRGRYRNVEKSYAGDLLKDDAVDKIRKAIEHYACQLPHIGEELPVAWINVRAEIEESAHLMPYFSQQEYFNIYAKYLPFNREKALFLSRYLHDLGVFLHFQDNNLLARTIILKNDWATKAVYKLLDDEDVKAKLGRFTIEDCRRVWHEREYAEMHPELIALMEQFELCYALPYSTEKTWISPQLLPVGKPSELRNWGRGGDLALRYSYQIMPKGIISRLMVRLHRFVPDPDMASVNCVLFERDGNTVLVDLTNDGRAVALRARGPERRDLMSVVAADLEAINAKFPGLHDKVDKLIPCICSDCIQEDDPYTYKEKDLRRRMQAGRKTIECENSYQNLNVRELLDGVDVKNLPIWATESEMKIIKIFLASSSELLEERNVFDLYFRTLNDRYVEKGIYFKVIRWENLSEAISHTRSQDEYNKEVRASSIFVGIFATKVGKFSEEEFTQALTRFKANNLPYVFTYFKNVAINTGSLNLDDLTSLKAFKEHLKKLEHFPGSYSSTEELLLKFRHELERFLDQGVF